MISPGIQLPSENKVYPDLVLAQNFNANSLYAGEYKYRPIIKERGFCPNPVVKYGIPSYADSRFDPSVRNTIAYKDYWEEQFNYCVNGYTTGGLFIPGRYYFYLNFCPISTVGRGYHYPDFIDLDYEYFLLYEYAKSVGKGMIILKARRRGMSEKYAKGIIGYGVRFRAEKYKAAIVAGLQTYADGLFDKFKELNSTIIPEFYVNHLKATDEKWIGGYEIKNSLGKFVKQGSFNEILCKTASVNENVLKSNYIDDLALEEAGEFDLLVPTFGASKDCMMDGDDMVGVPTIFGTGGNIQSQSKGFMEMWFGAESYNLLRFECYGQRLYKKHFIGSTNKRDEIEYSCPNITQHPLLKNVGIEQILGCEDTQHATNTILNNRIKYSKLPNKKKLYDELQNNPLNAKEAFLKFGTNPFSTEILNDAMHQVSAFAIPRYEKFLLSWARDKDKKIIIPLQVTATLASDEEPEENCVLVQERPFPGYKRLDVAGIDSYDVDESTSSKSLGGMCVIRRKNLKDNQDCRKIVAVVRQRPHRKELFYETTLMVAVWYDLIGNCMIDYAKPMIMEWWKRHGGRKYLAKRPRSFESDDSTQTHEFGMLATIRSKPQLISLGQSWVLDEAMGCYIPIVLNELQGYDTGVKESDCDLADALFLGLARIADMKTPAVDYSQEKYDPFADSDIIFDENGNPVRVGGQTSMDGKHISEYKDIVLQTLIKEGRY